VDAVNRKLLVVLIGSMIFLVVLIGVVGYLLYQPESPHIMINGVMLTVELAETPGAQEKGLSGRQSLPSDHGMLFIFDHEDNWGFWMVDMRFPLDIIWFNSNRQAVFFEQDLSPCTPQYCPVYTPDAKAMYVLEVNAGFVAAHQITLGTTFMFLDF
jgi:uncharacterized membrane protein (UPF0127 family)